LVAGGGPLPWACSPEASRAALLGQLSQELALLRYVDQATQIVTLDQVAATVECGPGPGWYVEQVRSHADIGLTHFYLHRVGSD